MNPSQPFDSHDASYSGAHPFEQRHALAFSPNAGARALHCFPRSRDRLHRALASGPAPGVEAFEGLDRLTRDANALRPEVLERLETEMDRLRLVWEVESAVRPTDTAEILEDILVPFVRARVPLRPRAQGAAWAHDAVLRLIERFAVFGSVHASYDHDWRKHESHANEPGPTVRLALAAGWLGWSDLLVDPSTSLDHLDVLMKLVDTIDRGVHEGRWQLSAFERGAALAALELEARLLRQWRRHRPYDEDMDLH